MRLLFLLLSVQLQAQVCMTDWFCTNGGGKTFIIPYSEMQQNNFYTIHHLDFGDGFDTSFVGQYNELALGYQAIEHIYDVGIYIGILTTSFYDSTDNTLLCIESKQDTICSYNTVNSINETQKTKNKNKMYDFFGRKLKKRPINQPYIINKRIFFNKF